MNKIKSLKLLFTSLGGVIPFFAVSCKTEKENNTKTDEKSGQDSTLNQKQETSNENLSNVEKWSNQNATNLLELKNKENFDKFLKLQNPVLVFDRVNKVVIYQPQGTKQVNWKEINTSEFELFELNTDTKFQLVHPIETIYENAKKQKRANSFLDYKIDNDKIIIKYKVYEYKKSDLTQITKKIFTSEISLNQEKNIKDNKQEESTSDVISNYQNIEIDATKYIYDSSDNYYQSLEGLSGIQLWKALNQINISKRQYNSGYKALPNFYNTSNAFKDTLYEKDNTILDIYSEVINGSDPYTFKSYKTVGGGSEGDGMNREHIIPQSWFNKTEPIRSDATFVWPTDIKVNNIRGNFPHDDVVTITQQTKNKSKLGKNINSETVFEVTDDFKGDIARAYFYFVSAYNDKDIYNGKNNIFTKNFPNIKSHYLKSYLNWHKRDKIDNFDVKRNNETYKFNKIRNPFIDYPDILNNIFGKNPKPFKNKGVLTAIK
ncbi:endonuclease [Mycoplasma leonicaptivi]|uniref:endonuclease n=1 Tax=Mycoplasma leonicaptivi TaxID=36742 RepID=UPI0006874644|nr:endonuclease [Mycoplasma leonicaptivi]